MSVQEVGIHPTAIVESGASLATDVKIGAYAYVGSQVTLGAGTVVHHHATVEGRTVLGERNTVGSYAHIGGKTQDTKFAGGDPGLKIGNDNVFREYVSIHHGTADGADTVLGSHNVFLAYSHVAHDCIVGDYSVMSSHAALGGHVQVGNSVNVAWGSGIHQFCKVGDHAMIGACSKVVQDVPPFMMVDGNPATARTINKVGMARAGYSVEEIETARKVYKVLYRSRLNRSQAIARLKKMNLNAAHIVTRLLAFTASSHRGLA